MAMTLSKPLKTDVLIVGAGPTGLVLAYELARRGVNFRLIDKNEGPAEQSRALLIQVRSLETFAFMGLIDEFLKKGLPIAQLHIFVKQKSLFQNNFQNLDSPYPFPLVLPQNDTEAILLAALAAKGIQVERQTELLRFEAKKDSVEVFLRKATGKPNQRHRRGEGEALAAQRSSPLAGLPMEGTTRVPVIEESFSCSYLVGCDGSHSVVRHGLDLPFKGSPYPEGFILADVELQSSLHPKDLYLLWQEKRFLAVLPMRDTRVRLISMRTPGSEASKEVTQEEFQSYVDRCIPGGGKILRSYWLANFHLHHRGVPRYQVDGVFLAGDAAHIHSPAGGQGMNTGIQDSFNLAWKLALRLKNPRYEKVLNSYSPERQPVGERVLKTTDRFFRIVVSAGLGGRFIRNFILPLVAKFVLPRVMGSVARFVSQLQVNYRSSSLVAQAAGQNWPSSSPKPGERAPDAPLKELATSRSLKLYEIFRNVEFILLVFLDSSKEINLEKLLADLNSLSPGLWKTVVIASSPEMKGAGYQDENGSLSKKYGLCEGLYLIRPDRYVGYRQQGFNLNSFQEYLIKISSMDPQAKRR